MDKFDIMQKLKDSLDHDERLVWTGSSNRFAYLPGHVPLLLFAIFFAVVNLTWGMPLLLDGGSMPLQIVSALFLLSAGMLACHMAFAILGDLSVNWGVSDRRVYRISMRRVEEIDVRAAVAIELREGSGTEGDVIVSMPQMTDDDGQARAATVVMLGLPDMKGAHSAICAAMRQA